MKTRLAVARAIEDLRSELRLAYGVDFAFTILAQGRIIAASNAVDGTIVAATNERDCPKCQDRPGYNGLGKTCKTCNGRGLVAL